MGKGKVVIQWSRSCDSTKQNQSDLQSAEYPVEFSPLTQKAGSKMGI